MRFEAMMLMKVLQVFFFFLYANVYTNVLKYVNKTYNAVQIIWLI